MPTGFNSIYESEVGPSHIERLEYMNATKHQFLQLLDTDPAEEEVQLFLEKHPSMVPGPLTPSGASGKFPLQLQLDYTTQVARQAILRSRFHVGSEAQWSLVSDIDRD